jgi:hypothetical protein
MADGVVGPNRVELHQALHGYAEGHRQIAASTVLKPRDAKTMLLLSDVSGPGARIDEGGYLTGYPLSESGQYAFARTWAAPEMPRPGCVWTHTLLIDFADLAVLPSLADLLRAFRRPASDVQAEYSKSLTLEWSSRPARIEPSAEAEARRVLAALYGKPSSRVIAMRASEADMDTVVIALWSQQWPRLRRGFRFCTLATSDRSTDGASFDLQLLPTGNQALRTRFSKAVEAESVSAAGEWLDEAVSDLSNPKPQGLRRFLRDIGGDVSGGRSAFPTLCRLHRLIAGIASDPSAVEDAIVVLQDDLGAAQARAARATVARAAASQAAHLEDAAFDYLMENLSLLDEATIDAECGTLASSILRRRPSALASMAVAGGVSSVVAGRALSEATVSDLVPVLRTAPTLAAAVLERRPQLAAEPAWWAHDLDLDNEGIQAMIRLPDRQPVLAAILAAGRSDLAAACVAAVGPKDVLVAVVNRMLRGELAPAEGERWVRAAADPGTLAQLFVERSGLSRRFLMLVSTVLGPDDLPNDYGDDPWCLAASRAEGQLPEQEEYQLRAFLLARSFGSRSRNQAELARLGFEATHVAAAANRLDDRSWRWLDERLPWSMLWFDWDRCQRLRAGVVSLFVERNLSPETFGRLVGDGRLFGLLAEQAARSSSGRAFLKQVRKALKNAPDVSALARRDFIERLVK